MQLLARALLVVLRVTWAAALVLLPPQNVAGGRWS